MPPGVIESQGGLDARRSRHTACRRPVTARKRAPAPTSVLNSFVPAVTVGSLLPRVLRQAAITNSISRVARSARTPVTALGHRLPVKTQDSSEPFSVSATLVGASDG